jgi:hypothetical protein
MTISEKITNNPIISFLVLCSITVTAAVSLVTWFYEMEKRNISSKHNAEVSILKNDYESKLIKIENKLSSLKNENISLQKKYEIISDLKTYKKETVNISNDNTKNLSEKNKHQYINDTDGLLFALNSCSLSGSKITCNLSIKNNRNNDTELIITHCALFDQAGIKYNATRASIAGRATGWMEEQELISGVKTTANIVFNVGRGDIEKITALKFYTSGAFGSRVSHWGDKGADTRLISFRDIPLIK